LNTAAAVAANSVSPVSFIKHSDQYGIAGSTDAAVPQWNVSNEARLFHVRKHLDLFTARCHAPWAGRLCTVADRLALMTSMLLAVMHLFLMCL